MAHAHKSTSLVVAIITGVLTPYMLNPTEWDWSNYTGFFWVGGILLCPCICISC
jgi:hypothetical protein